MEVWTAPGASYIADFECLASPWALRYRFWGLEIPGARDIVHIWCLDSPEILRHHRFWKSGRPRGPQKSQILEIWNRFWRSGRPQELQTSYSVWRLDIPRNLTHDASWGSGRPRRPKTSSNLQVWTARGVRNHTYLGVWTAGGPTNHRFRNLDDPGNHGWPRNPIKFTGFPWMAPKPLKTYMVWTHGRLQNFIKVIRSGAMRGLKTL